MSTSIDSKEIPAWTLQQVRLEGQSVFIEAWAREDPEKEAIRVACGNLREGDVVLLEAKDSYGERRVCGARRIAWIQLREAGESGKAKLVLQMAFRGLGEVDSEQLNYRFRNWGAYIFHNTIKLNSMEPCGEIPSLEA